MRTLAAPALLTAWEQVRSLPAARRPSALLHAFGLSEQPSVGRCEAALLDVFTDNFGDDLVGLARCPECAAEVELNVPVADVVAAVPAAQPVEPLHVDGRTLHWRLPDRADLEAVAGCADPEDAARLLASRCLPEHDGALVGPARQLLAERIAAADPYADLSFTLTCPGCAAVWDCGLEIAEFVWSHLRSRAQRLLREVDELARAYGWSEGQILALSQQRRDSYLELVRDG